MKTVCKHEEVEDMSDVLTLLAGSLSNEQRTVGSPQRTSFAEFLARDARVPVGDGRHGPYSFSGREALLAIVRVVDKILAEKLTDAEVSLAGGAQFGKTILELNLAAYVTGQRFRNFGLYLPDDDLVEGIVDSKFRPDVVDQIAWFARMVQVGKALNQSGRAVNRKGAFLVTDGVRRAMGIIRGLGKVPTTFSLDVAALDEVDDIDPRRMKFVRGRLAASDLRFVFKIGTQRIHGRGMNRAWKDGSQGIFNLKCPKCGRMHNPEEEFPGIVRLNTGGTSSTSPQLTWSGDFHFNGDELSTLNHTPLNSYYLGCVSCGAELDRTRPIEQHRAPALIAQRKWSYRISQLAIAAIDLTQIVTRFQSAVADPDEMIVFRCDVLGLPQSTAQALTPAILDRAMTAYELGTSVHTEGVAYGGLDMGDRCWFFARSLRDGHQNNFTMAEPTAGGASVPASRLNAHQTSDNISARDYRQPAISFPVALTQSVEKIPAGDVIARVQTLFHTLGLRALFIDERPLVNEARSLALALNGLQNLETWPRLANPATDYVSLPGGLTWDGKNSRWLNLRCAVVRFTKTKLGAGIEQTIIFFEEGGQTKFVPCIACNRFETIDRVVREFLTPTEGVVEILPDKKIRQTPALLLPRQSPHAPILETLGTHLITGSEREKSADGSLGDYVDGGENHLLLADAYSKLAEIICGSASQIHTAPIYTFETTRRSHVLAARGDRRAEG